MASAPESPAVPTISLPVSAEDHQIARLASAAIALSLIDAAIPLPLPGVKPGLANIVVLIVLYRHGWTTACWVSLLRVLAGSLLLGQFLAPGFFLGLSGALTSLVVLGLTQYLPARHFNRFGAIGCGTHAHIGGQLLLARLWLVPHDGVFVLSPLFALAALIFGVVNGLVASRLLAEMPPPSESAVEETRL